MPWRGRVDLELGYGRPRWKDLGADLVNLGVVLAGVDPVAGPQLTVVFLGVACPSDREVAVEVDGHVGPFLVRSGGVVGIQLSHAEGVDAERVALPRPDGAEASGVDVGVAVAVVGPGDDEIAVLVGGNRRIPLIVAREIGEVAVVRGDLPNRGDRRPVGVVEGKEDAVFAGGARRRPDHHVIAVGVDRHLLGGLGEPSSVGCDSRDRIQPIVGRRGRTGDDKRVAQVLAAGQVAATRQRVAHRVAQATLAVTGGRRRNGRQGLDRVGPGQKGLGARRRQVAVERDHHFPLVGGDGTEVEEVPGDPGDRIPRSGQVGRLVHSVLDARDPARDLDPVGKQPIVLRVEDAIVTEEVHRLIEHQHGMRHRTRNRLSIERLLAVVDRDAGRQRARRVGVFAEATEIDVLVGRAAPRILFVLRPDHHEIAVRLHADRDRILRGARVAIGQLVDSGGGLRVGREAIADQRHPEIRVVHLALEGDFVDDPVRPVAGGIGGPVRVVPIRALTARDFGRN